MPSGDIANGLAGRTKLYLFDTSVQHDFDPANSAGFCTSSYFLLSGFGLSERIVNTVAGVGQFHYLSAF